MSLCLSSQFIVCEDDPLMQESLRHFIGDKLKIYTSLLHFLDSANIKDCQVEAFIVDLCHSGDPEGEKTIRKISELRSYFPRADIIIFSGLAEKEIMQQCLENGANYYWPKDVIVDNLSTFLENLKLRIKKKELLREKLIGQSQAITELRENLLSCILGSKLDLLLEGESGVGKEVCASCFEGDDKFLALNCGALPEDIFESEFFGSEKGAFTGAHKSRVGLLESVGTGVIFLDEIQSLSLNLQAKLLRVIENREFRSLGSNQVKKFMGRFVFASNQSLHELTQKGRFREDLYYRVTSLRLMIPPLRARKGDVSILIDYFLKKNPAPLGLTLSSEAKKLLEEDYEWPGNIRELRNLIHKLVTFQKSPIVDEEMILKHLGFSDHSFEKKEISEDSVEGYALDWSLSFDENVELYEQFYLKKALGKYSKRDCPIEIKMSRSRFYEKLKAYQLSID